MCGLFGGLSTTLNADEVSNIRDLGILAQFRGFHSTGMAFVCDGKKNRMMFSSLKQVGDSTGFMFHPDTLKLIGTMKNPRAFIGHCRHATIGTVTKENAHPFTKGKIIGVHNGTVDKLKPAKGVDTTDSEALISLIAEKGIEEAIEQAKDGAYALVYFDTEARTLNMIRNYKRPLWLIKSKSGSTIYWSSEKIMLEFMARRDTLKYDDPYEIPVHTLHTWKVGEVKETTRKIEPKYEPIVYNPYKSPFRRDLQSMWDPEWEKELDEEREKKVDFKPDGSVLGPILTHKGPSTPISETPYDVDSNLLHDSFDDYADEVFPLGPPQNRYPARVRNRITQKVKLLRFSGFDDDLLTIPEANKLLAKGCALTKKQARISDIVWWISKDEYITQDNKDDEFIMSYLQGDTREEITRGQLVYACFNSIKKVEARKKKTCGDNTCH